MASQPLVSVCIPTYNRADLLERCLSSARNWDYSPLEIIISDNASTDRTAEVCQSAAERDSRVRVLRHPHNKGPTANFISCREEARGIYFMWLADDDEIPDYYISRCVAELEKDSGLCLVSGLARYHRGDGKIFKRGNHLKLDSPNINHRRISYLWNVLENSVFYGVYRREAVKDCELRNCLAADCVWMMEVLTIGRVLVLKDLQILRSLELSISNRRGEVVRVLQLPGWNARHPYVAMALNLSNNLVFSSRVWLGFCGSSMLWFVDWAVIAAVVLGNRFRWRMIGGLKRRRLVKLIPRSRH